MKLILSILLVFGSLISTFSQDQILLIDSVLVKYNHHTYYQLEVDSIWINKNQLPEIYGSRGRKNACVFQGQRRGSLPWNGFSTCYGRDGELIIDTKYYEDGKLGILVFE